MNSKYKKQKNKKQKQNKKYECLPKMDEKVDEFQNDQKEDGFHKVNYKDTQVDGVKRTLLHTETICQRSDCITVSNSIALYPNLQHAHNSKNVSMISSGVKIKLWIV